MIARRMVLPISMALVFLGVWYFLREPGERVAVIAPVVTTANSAPAPRASADELQVAAPATSANASVDQLIADANSGDAQRRAAAISALANAPRAQAVPALSHVLMNGEPTLDRPLALRSLQKLALAQGDADGAVRAAFREVIYHGDDESLMSAAQESLGVVENSVAKQP